MWLGRHKDAKKGISLLGIAKFDELDVLAPVGIILLILPYMVKGAPTFLVPIGGTILGLWLLLVIVLNMRKKDNGASAGSASAPRKASRG